MWVNDLGCDNQGRHMKTSRYNHFIRHNQGVLAFNAVSCGFAEIDQDLYEALTGLAAGSPTELQSQIIQRHSSDLKRGHFVVEDNCDEVRSFRVVHNLWKYDTTTLALTIAPTLACNFGCTYCFEGNLPRIKMTPEICQAIVDFVEHRAAHLAELSIAWYGGEPLLASDVIIDLSDRLIATTQKHGCRYSASIVTNGWFLTREVAEQLRDRKVSLVQITLDGPEAIHDQRRPLKGGGSTYQRILTNLKAIKGVFDQVALRINVDEANIDEVGSLYTDLKKNDLLDSITPYLGKVTPLTEACADIEPVCFDTASFARAESQLLDDLRAKGIPAPTPYPRFCGTHCGVVRLNAYVIDPFGRMYKCWNVIGREEESVGNIQENAAHGPVNDWWLSFEPMDIAECRECNILPICAGGCPYYYYKGEHVSSGKPNCVSWRYLLDEHLQRSYQQWKANAAGQLTNQTTDRAKLVAEV